MFAKNLNLLDYFSKKLHCRRLIDPSISLWNLKTNIGPLHFQVVLSSTYPIPIPKRNEIIFKSKIRCQYSATFCPNNKDKFSWTPGYVNLMHWSVLTPCKKSKHGQSLGNQCYRKMNEWMDGKANRETWANRTLPQDRSLKRVILKNF